MVSKNSTLQMNFVMLIVFLGCAGVSFPYPVIAPLFLGGETTSLTQWLGLSPEILLGLVIAAYPLGMVIGSALLGSISDSFGRKKLLSISLVFSVLGYLLCAYAVVIESYLVFLLARFAIGLCEGNVSVARAIASDLCEEKDKTVALSKINAAVYSGLLAGPILGGLAGSQSTEFVFVLAAMVYILCWLIVLFLVQETNTVHAVKSVLPNVKLFNNKLYFQLLLIQLLMAIGTCGAYHFIPVWLTSVQGFSPTEIGFSAAIMSALMILSSLKLVPRVSNKLNKKQIYVVFGLTLSLLYFCMVVLTPNLSLFVFLVTGIPISILSGAFPAYVVQKLGEERSGLLLGSLSSMTSIASVLVALGGSMLLTFDHAAPIAVSSLFCFLSVGLFMFVLKTTSEESLLEHRVKGI
ncbi:MFS transporter [Vibrio splendidus]